jgi:sigma-B regulation protein RsbU (phosphoserine phosphatase)
MQHVFPALRQPTRIARPIEVLLVDDDDLFLDFTAWELQRLGCQVTVAGSAERGLALLAEREFDAVITDWQMPGVDGLELVARGRAMTARDGFCYFVLTTAAATSQTVAQALRAGVDDVLLKPLEAIRLELLIASVRRTVALHRRVRRHNRHLATAHRRTREAYRRVEADLEAAATLHRNLLPRREPEDRVDFGWIYHPAQSLGGDTIGLATGRNGTTLFFVADVRGHGVPAALASFHVHHRLIQLAPERPDELEKAVATLNRELLAQPGDNYVTLICGLLDPSTSGGWLLRAGHPLPMLIDGSGAHPFEVGGGFALGWFDDARFRAQPFAMPEDARLVLYSDGLTDCADRDGNELGTSGLQDLLDRTAGGTLGAMKAGIELAIRQRSGNQGLVDDISMLMLQRRCKENEQ